MMNRESVWTILRPEVAPLGGQRVGLGSPSHLALRHTGSSRPEDYFETGQQRPAAVFQGWNFVAAIAFFSDVIAVITENGIPCAPTIKSRHESLRGRPSSPLGQCYRQSRWSAHLGIGGKP